MRRLSSESAASRRTAPRKGLSVAGRDEECALLVDEQLAGGGRVGGDERRRACDGLERLVRNDALRLAAGRRRFRASNRRAGSLPAGARTRSTARARRSAAATRAGPRAARCRRGGSRSPAPPSRPARIVSTPCSGISLPTKSATKRSGGDQFGLNSRSSAPTKQTGTSSSPASPAKNCASAAVSATTTSAARNARRSAASRARAANEPGRNRPRSVTSVSTSETSGLKTTGRPRAARRAAGRSKCPG